MVLSQVMHHHSVEGDGCRYEEERSSKLDLSLQEESKSFAVSPWMLQIGPVAR